MGVDYEALKKAMFGSVGAEAYRQMELAEKLNEMIRPYNALQSQIDDLTKASRGLHGYLGTAGEIENFNRNKYFDRLFAIENMSEKFLGKKYSSAYDAAEKIRSVYVDIQKSLGIHTSLQDYQKSVRNQLIHKPSLDWYVSSSHNDFAAALAEIQKPFKALSKGWSLSDELGSTISVLDTLQKQVERLKVPTLDWASVAALSDILGPEGIRSQLAKLGIDEEGELAEGTNPHDVSERGVGFSRRTMDLLTLFSIVWAVFFTMRQEISSAEWQSHVDDRFTELELINKEQLKQLESLSRLIEVAIEKETKRSEVSYMVRERVAPVRSRPDGGATEGKLLPNEVVVVLLEKGKWVQVRYYHWLDQDYKSGWVLKKYLRRVPSNYLHDKKTSDN